MQVRGRAESRKSGRVAAWAVVEAVTGAFFSTVTYLLMTWWVPAEEIGLGLLALALGQMAASLVEFVFSDFVIANPDLEKRKLGELNAANIGLGIAMAALLALVAPPLERALEAPGLSHALWMLASIIVCSGIGAIPLACMKRDMAFDLLARRTLGVRVLSGCLGLGMAWFGFGVLAIVVQQITLSVANVVILLVLRRLPLARPGRSDVVASAFRFAGGNIFPSFMSGNVNRLLVFVVGFIASPTEVAFVGMATRIVDALTFPLIGGLGQVTLPILSRAKAQGYVLAETYRKAASLTSVVAIPAFVGLAICSPMLTAVILAPRWAPAAFFISSLALERAIRIIVSLNGPLVTISGHSPANFRLSLVDIGFGLLLLMILGQFGIVAGMIGWSMKAIVYIPLSWRTAQKFSGISVRQQIAASRNAIVAAFGMAMASMLAGSLIAKLVGAESLKALLAVEIVVGVGSYLAILHCLDRTLVRFIIAQIRHAPASPGRP